MREENYPPAMEIGPTSALAITSISLCTALLVSGSNNVRTRLEISFLLPGGKRKETKEKRRLLKNSCKTTLRMLRVPNSSSRSAGLLKQWNPPPSSSASGGHSGKLDACFRLFCCEFFKGHFPTIENSAPPAAAEGRQHAEQSFTRNFSTAGAVLGRLSFVATKETCTPTGIACHEAMNG